MSLWNVYSTTCSIVKIYRNIHIIVNVYCVTYALLVSQNAVYWCNLVKCMSAALMVVDHRYKATNNQAPNSLTKVRQKKQQRQKKTHLFITIFGTKIVPTGFKRYNGKSEVLKDKRCKYTMRSRIPLKFKAKSMTTN